MILLVEGEQRRVVGDAALALIVGELALVLGAATPAFAPFIKAGDQVWAFRLVSPPIQQATPESSPVPATPEVDVETPPEGSPAASPVS